MVVGRIETDGRPVPPPLLPPPQGNRHPFQFGGFRPFAVCVCGPSGTNLGSSFHELFMATMEGQECQGFLSSPLRKVCASVADP